MTIQLIDDVLISIDEVAQLPVGPDKTRGFKAIFELDITQNDSIRRTMYFVSNDIHLDKPDVLALIKNNKQLNLVVHNIRAVA
jgi:hypothetical protein